MTKDDTERLLSMLESREEEHTRAAVELHRAQERERQTKAALDAVRLKLAQALRGESAT